MEGVKEGVDTLLASFWTSTFTTAIATTTSLPLFPPIDIKTTVRQINAVNGDDAWASTDVSFDRRLL